MHQGNKKTTGAPWWQQHLSGFTLLELLIVVAIIGILSTIGYFQVNTARGRARDAKRLAELRTIADGLALYYENNGKYPTAGAISGTFEKDASDSLPDGFPWLRPALVPAHISSIPLDPINRQVNGKYYRYVYNHDPDGVYCGAVYTGYAFLQIYYFETRQNSHGDSLTCYGTYNGTMSAPNGYMIILKPK